MIDTALQFSGGKDSLACLYLYREKWDQIYVLWVNTGAAYPDVVESMEGWKRILPHFVEIKTNQPEQVATFGYPSDVVPIKYTVYGRLLSMKPEFLIQGWDACCAANIQRPMYDMVKKLGIKRLISGQRSDDYRKGPTMHGKVYDGIECVHPLEGWTKEEVFSYLREVGAEIPGYYKTEQTSHDCWSCTAYLDENKARIDNLPEDKRAIVVQRLGAIAHAVLEESRFL